MSECSARIIPLDKEQAIKVAAEHGMPEHVAKLYIFRVLLNHPVLAKEINGTLLMLFSDGLLSTRLRELIIMRLGWATRSEYEWAQHWVIAQHLGLEPDVLLAVRDWQNSELLDETDKAVMAATDETLANGAISLTTWQQLENRLNSTEQLLEVVACIGNWRMISQILRSLDVSLDPWLESWAPDGLAPSNS